VSSERAITASNHPQIREESHNKGRRSRIDARTTRHPGYAVSQVKRKRIEEIFGWLKTVALMRKLRHRGRAIIE
jgi:hypothetical protein